MPHPLIPPAAIPVNGTPPSYEAASRTLHNETQETKRANRALLNVCLLLGLSSVIGIGSAVYFARTAKTFVYVVEVAEPGQVRTVGILPQTWRGQAPAVLEQTARDWLYRMRRVGSDPVILTEQLRQANAMMAQKAIGLAKADVARMFELLKKEWVTQIEILSVLPLTSDWNAIEIEWRERTYNRQGGLVSEEPWKAILNVAIYTPAEIKDVKELRNPLGIFITDYAWRITGKGAS